MQRAVLGVEVMGADPEEAADMLLRAAGALGRRTGIYTHVQLERKLRMERRRPGVAADHGLPEEIMQYLFRRRIDDLVECSRLTRVQEIVFRLSADGLSCADIAAVVGIKRQAIASHLKLARRKVRATCREGRYAGWYEVYLGEVNRFVYRFRRQSSGRVCRL